MPRKPTFNSIGLPQHLRPTSSSLCRAVNKEISVSTDKRGLMQRIFYISFLSFLVCTGCAAPDKLKKHHVRNISSISIAINTTIASDAPGFTDSVDVPLNKSMADKLIELIKSTLMEKGFKPVDQHRSVGMAYSREKFYVITTESDRERKTSELKAKPGPYYSERLGSQQLKALYKDVADKDDIPTLGNMGFSGDATLVALIKGRIIGADKTVGAYLANAAIITLFVAGGGGSFGGSPDLVNTDDTYEVQLRLYSTKDGDILWQSDIEAHGFDEVLRETKNILQKRIPTKK
ncbi:MAG: hypothetical protein PVJ72_14900 [Gammaproteobacteria bacterium]|jgi:hypothetical protein